MELNEGGLSSLVIGREKEIQTLKTYMGFSQYTVITAPRRYGKTTLANRVLDDLKDDKSIKKFDMNSSYKSQLTKELRSESLLSNDNKPTDPFFSLWIGK